MYNSPVLRIPDPPAVCTPTTLRYNSTDLSRAEELLLQISPLLVSYFSNLCKYDCYRTHQNFEAPAYFLYAQYAIPVVFTSARELRVNRRGCQIWSSRNERRGGFGNFSIMNLDRKKCVWCPVLESIQRVCISPGENNCLKPPPATTRDASRPWMGQTPPPTFNLPLDKLYQYLYSSTLAGGCR